MAPGGLSGAVWAQFLAWARKLLQEASLGLSGIVFNRGSEMAPGGLSGAFWGSLGPFSGLGSKMVPGGLSGALWGRFLAE
eukprot:3482306-Karenia_brevis.AAC.1